MSSRVSRALKVERGLNVNLDSTVSDNNKTFDLLISIPKKMKEVSVNYKNAVRK